MSSPEFGFTTVKYAALSYCWGGPQDFQLNAQSEDALSAGVSPSTLPKTLSDAIEVAHNLGIQWIWIDSLCIRQDDVEDIALEIVRMHLIYGDSFITISAARARHCSQGFLHQDSLPSLGVARYQLPVVLPAGKRGTAILTRCNEDYIALISERGWTFQEHFLARRVLRFTDRQLHWSCKGSSKFEVEEITPLPSMYLEPLEREYTTYRAIHDGKRDCRQWMNIVEEYTRRELTDGSDKLPAMSGIAEFWAQVKEDHYLAGLWASHLPLGLLWTIDHLSQQNELQVYRAPSWSWASPVGQMRWFDHLLPYVDSIFQIKSCIANPAFAAAPYGAVLSGYLVVYGLLQETSISKSGQALGVEDGAGYLDLQLARLYLDF
jgi:hypothetical protein